MFFTDSLKILDLSVSFFSIQINFDWIYMYTYNQISSQLVYGGQLTP